MKKPTEAGETTPKKTTRKKAADPDKTVPSTPVEAGGSGTWEQAAADPLDPVESGVVGEMPSDTAIPAAGKKATVANAAEDDGTSKSETDSNDPVSGAGAGTVTNDSKTPDDAPPDLIGSARADAPKTPVDADGRQSGPPSLPAPSGAEPGSRSGFWPLVLGGVVAAGLGSAATIVLLPSLPPGWLPQSEASDADADRDDLLAEARSAGEDAARSIIADMPEGADTTPELQAAIEAQSQRIDTLVQAMEEPAEGTAVAGAEEISALQTRLDELTQQVQGLADEATSGEASDQAQALSDQVSQAQEQVRAAAEEATRQIEAVRAEAESLQQAAEDSTRRAEGIAAVAALQNALDQGVSTDTAVEGLREAGIEPPAAVTADAPSLAVLQEDYDAAARQALRAALREGAPEEGTGGVIANFLRAQTGARSVEPREGDDPDAILSRADAAVAAGDLRTALTELAALPGPARDAPAMADWLAGAQAHVDARDAVAELASGNEPDVDADAPASDLTNGSAAEGEAGSAAETATAPVNDAATDQAAATDAENADAETSAADAAPQTPDAPADEASASEQPAAEPAQETN